MIRVQPRLLVSLKALTSRHPKRILAILFIVTWAAMSFVFYLRYPNNFTQPNFYAEDGKNFISTILKEPIAQSTFSPFNGYFVVGLYLLGESAVALRTLLFGGVYIELPRAIALTSYLFLGFCAALPLVTLNKVLRPAYRGLAVIAVAFAPMPLNDYVVIGTLGNLKFAFAFIAALLVIKRLGLKRDNALIPILDVGVLICAFTTASVYLLVPFYLLADGLSPKQLMNVRSVLRRNNVALYSLAGLALLLLTQLAFVAIHGIPKLPGYLDEPYRPQATIEIFGARTLIFGLMPPLYRFLNDWLSVGLLVVATGVIAWAARSRQLLAIVLLSYTSMIASVLFVANRTGLSGMFQHYTWSGPDQFFYAQTMLMALVGVVILQSVAAKIKWRYAGFAVVALGAVMVASVAPYASSYGREDSMAMARGTIYQAAKAACRQPGAAVSIDIYPTAPWEVSAPRNEVCTPALYRHKTYHTIDLGLAVTGNQPVNLAATSARQRFEVNSASGKVAGIDLFFSTYQRPIRSDYALRIYRDDCKTTISTTKLATASITDNAWSETLFTPLTAPGTYCFTVIPTQRPAQPLAIQQSGVNPNSVAPASIDGTDAPLPLAFRLVVED